MYYGTPIEYLRINRSVPKVIFSVFRTDGYKICTGRTIIIILEPNIFSFRQFFFFIHLHHPRHYNTNRQKEKSFCRNCELLYEPFVSYSPFCSDTFPADLFIALASAAVTAPDKRMITRSAGANTMPGRPVKKNPLPKR